MACVVKCNTVKNVPKKLRLHGWLNKHISTNVYSPFSRRLGYWGLATQLPGLFFYGCRSLEHDGRHLTRSHDRGLRIHELEDARLHTPLCANDR